MTLSIKNRNKIREETKRLVDNLLSRNVKPNPQSKNKWKFTNSADWHYGHFVGMAQMNASNIFVSSNFRQPDKNELEEIEEIIEELGKPFREYLQSTF